MTTIEPSRKAPKHSQDKGTAVQQALRTLQDENEQRAAAAAMSDAAQRRDYPTEVKASDRYEELRLLDRGQLATMAGYDAPRQQLIASIINDELGMRQRVRPWTLRVG